MFAARRNSTESTAQPCLALLEAAAAELVARGIATAAPRWQVLKRFDRPRSVLYKLEAIGAGAPVTAFCKLERPKPHWDSVRTEGWRSSVRRAMLVEQALAASISPALAGIGVRFDEPLVLDADRLIGVRLAVPGTQISRLWQWRLPLPSRVLVDCCSAIGAAVANIERTGKSLPLPGGGFDMQSDVCQRARRNSVRLQQLLGPNAVQRVERAVAEIDAKEIGVTWSHGDVSPTNIIVGDRIPGLIDFSWKPQIESQDIVRFIARLELSALAFQSRTGQFASAVLDGYGIDARAPTANWLLAQIRHALQLLQADDRRLQQWACRALDAVLRK